MMDWQWGGGGVIGGGGVEVDGEGGQREGGWDRILMRQNKRQKGN